MTTLAIIIFQKLSPVAPSNRSVLCLWVNTLVGAENQYSAAESYVLQSKSKIIKPTKKNLLQNGTSQPWLPPIEQYAFNAVKDFKETKVAVCDDDNSSS